MMLLQLVLVPTTAPWPYNYAVMARDMYGVLYYPEAAGINYSPRMLSSRYGFIYEYLASNAEISRILLFKIPEANQYHTMPIPLGTLFVYPTWYHNHNILHLYTASTELDLDDAINDVNVNINLLVGKYGATAVQVLRDAINIHNTPPITPVPQLEPSTVEEELAQIASAKLASLETLAHESSIRVQTPEPESVIMPIEEAEQLDIITSDTPAKKKKKKKKKASQAQANTGILTWVYNNAPNVDIQTAKQIGMSATVAAIGGLINSVASSTLTTETESTVSNAFITPRSAATTTLLFMGAFWALRRRQEPATTHAATLKGLVGG